MPPTLTAGERDTFTRQGYLLVRDRIPPARIDAMTGVISDVVEREAHSMLQAAELDDLAAEQPFERRWYHVWRQHGGKQRSHTGWHTRVFSRALFDLWVEPAILDVVEALIGPEIQFNGDFWVRPKLPDEQETTLPWHQDSGYMPDTAHQRLLTLWMPLVETSAENGTLQFLPGSQQMGIQEHATQSGSFRTTAFDPAADAHGRHCPDEPRRLRAVRQPGVPPFHREPRRRGALVDRLPLQPGRHPDGPPVARRHGVHRAQPAPPRSRPPPGIRSRTRGSTAASAGNAPGSPWATHPRLRRSTGFLVC